MAHFRKDPSLVVGDNQPYSGELAGDTLYSHGTLRGLPHALIELRQDLVDTEANIEAWVDRLEEGLRQLLKSPEIWEVKHFGSHSDTWMAG
jgi:predicted N-formylglutamate amidohydrolase